MPVDITVPEDVERRFAETHVCGCGTQWQVGALVATRCFQCGGLAPDGLLLHECTNDADAELWRTKLD